MATKDLSRTVIEGGRGSYNKRERYASNEMHRAQSRAFCHDVANLTDTDDADVAPKRKKVGKDFRDKLSPMYRWLKSQVGRAWHKIYAELVAKFDTRTVAGRHVVFSHLLSDVTLQPTDARERYWGNFYVDPHGILRLHPHNSWNRRARYRDRSHPSADEINGWVAGRRVMDYGTTLFWMVPADAAWRECGYYSNRRWSRGLLCKQTEHREATKRVAVSRPEKLLAIEKAELYSEVKDGVRIYYREQKIKQCRQGRSYKQETRLTDDDLKMWNRLNDSERAALRW
jgi:hypothetical protein